MLLEIIEGARLDRLLSCGCDGGCDNRYVWGSEKTEKEKEEEVKNA